MSNFLKQAKSDVKWLNSSGSKSSDRVQSATFNFAKHTMEQGDWTGLNTVLPTFAKTRLNREQFITYAKALFVGIKFDKDTGLFLKKGKKTRVEIDTTILDVHFMDYSKVVDRKVNVDKKYTVDALISAFDKFKADLLDDNVEVTGDVKAATARYEAAITAVKALDVAELSLVA